MIFLNNSKLNFFPKVINNDDDHLIMSYIYNNGIQPNETNDDFLKAIISLHSLNNDKYGFIFDTQIGGLKQINEFKIEFKDAPIADIETISLVHPLSLIHI